MEFNIEREDKNGVTVLRLKGKLIDHESAEAVKHTTDELIAEDKTSVVVDLDGLTYLNSNGLNALVSLLTKCRNRGGEMVVCCINEKVRRLFVITKLINVFTVRETLNEGLEAMQQAISEN